MDLRVDGGGSVYLLRPVSPAGKAWIKEHIPPDALRFGPAVAVEHRYIGPIIEGAASDGLAVGRGVSA